MDGIPHLGRCNEVGPPDAAPMEAEKGIAEHEEAAPNGQEKEQADTAPSAAEAEERSPWLPIPHLPTPKTTQKKKHAEKKRER